VPLYLHRFAPAAATVVVALMEVEDGKASPAQYLADVPEALAPAYDFVWFTPRAQRPDPCATLHARGGKPQ
jgi:hypothetical protein